MSKQNNIEILKSMVTLYIVLFSLLGLTVYGGLYRINNVNVVQVYDITKEFLSKATIVIPEEPLKQTKTYTHIVSSGETFNGIVNLYCGVDYDCTKQSVIEDNGLVGVDLNKVKIGQTIIIKDDEKE